MRLVVLVGLIALPFVTGCFFSAPAPRRSLAPLTSEQQVEVDGIYKQANAIIQVVMANTHDNPTDDPTARADATRTLTHAGNAKDDLALNDGQHPLWLVGAREEIGLAEAGLLKLKPADPAACTVEQFKIAAPEACAQAASSATAEVAHAQTLVERAQAAQEMAIRAIHLAASDDENHQVDVYSTCNNVTMCIQASEKEEHKMGAHAGLALLLARAVGPSETQIATAEKFAATAMNEAKVIASVKAEENQKLGTEVQPIKAATDACNKDFTRCKATCDHGDDPYACIPWAVHRSIMNPPDYDTAVAVLTTSCSTGHILTACSTLQLVSADAQRYATEVDGLWRAVKGYGDDLAGTRWDRATLDKYSSGTKGYADKVREFANYERALLDEHYCPARKDFISKAGLAEFTKRTSSHCKGDPPSAQAYSGGQVEIPAQCRSAYATPCP
jgi:hypothetical protein